MTAEDTPLSLLSAMITPAVLISACGTLIFSRGRTQAVGETAAAVVVFAPVRPRSPAVPRDSRRYPAG